MKLFASAVAAALFIVASLYVVAPVRLDPSPEDARLRASMSPFDLTVANRQSLPLLQPDAH